LSIVKNLREFAVHTNFNKVIGNVKDFVKTTTRRTKIKYEKHELTLISLPPGAKFVCSVCRTEIDHLRDAGSLAVPDANIFCSAKREMVHSTETAEEKLSISERSEQLFADKRKTEDT